MSSILERLLSEEPSEALIRGARKEIERLRAEKTLLHAALQEAECTIADLRDARDGRSVYELQLEDQVKDMQAVVDAARELRDKHDLRCGTQWFRALDDALDALDGEVKP
jgi:hypothetical protein